MEYSVLNLVCTLGLNKKYSQQVHPLLIFTALVEINNNIVENSNVNGHSATW